MSEEMLVRHCSPTIIGLKTGNMFTFSFESKEQEWNTLKNLNKQLSPKGLRIIPLRRHKGSTLLYLYRPSKLQKDLRHETADKLLRECGYANGNPNKCVVQLIKRLRESEEFPHEIGLFLGYPPEDVCGFIKNKAQCCKCVGCWKVYGDVKKAQATFDKYKHCTELCCSLNAKGCSVEQLAACY